MAGVTADQGHVQQHNSAPPPSSGNIQHLKVTPENVVDLAEAIHQIIETLDASTSQNLALDLLLPSDAFLGDPHSKWAVEEFNEYLVNAENSFTNVVTRLIAEHKRTYNALKEIADSYGKTDEWNARQLNEAYGLP
ncbi:hypothetical protein [Labedaea rhizosphaerae]|uniref:PE family protein n=1 Tax=Labedaea rhizosphaerae TaxID=598644 RepID=A0A4R6SPH7_LABRH|nr:hypothetical protein [Labedaea rhizosphaerae]TDQ05123.1 hypothetical protein EV186_1011088 [Labedaea rhizosphaerae]